jgi:hypothetical protein
VAVLLKERENFNRERLVFPVPALATVFLERPHEEHVDEMKTFFQDVVYRVAFYEKHIFMSEVHREYRDIKRTGFLKRPLTR